MGYKKFSVSPANNTVQNISAVATQNTPSPPDRIIESVSVIEINEVFSGGTEKTPKKQKKFRPAALFLTLCAAGGACLSLFPLPSGLDIPLKLFAEYLVPVSAYTDTAKTSEADISPSSIQFENNSITSEVSNNTQNVSVAPATAQADTMPQSAATKLSSGNMTRISNETGYTVNISELLGEKYPIERMTTVNVENTDAVEVFAQPAPQVLIIHTHGTEGYVDTAMSGYRTHDTEKNVVAVGKKLADELEARGIGVIHCKEMFDAQSYIKAYSNSYAAVSEYLAEYPSIKYVIDLHRDAIPDSAASGYARLSADIDGKSYAQLMLVVGTDEAGAAHHGWRNNLRTAFGIQKALCEDHPDLMRSVNLRKASFNQQLSQGYFILEAGNCGNDISEALASMSLFADSFVETVTGT